MRLIVFLGLFLPVVIAGMSVYAFNVNKKFLKLLVAFSGAYIISLVFNELLPQIYSSLEHSSLQHNCVHESHTLFHLSQHHILGLLILAGFFIQLILDYITKGVEHGHIGHTHTHNCEHCEHTEKSISIIPIMIGLFLHSFLEGMPLADNLNNIELQNRLLTGIIIHNIPISIVLVSLMIQSKITKTKLIVFLCIFALSAPAGALFTHILGNHAIESSVHFFNYIMALVIGIFLHISTTILFETDEGHKFNLIKFITMLFGVFVAIVHF